MTAAPSLGMTLPRAFLRACRAGKRRVKVADSSGAELTGSQLLLRTLILRRILLREVIGPDEKFVGLLLPPSAGGVLANAALPLANRVAVNLNYTVSPEVIRSCIEQCNIKHVLTSRRFMDRLKLKVDAELVYLEDFAKKATKLDKLVAAAQAMAMPVGWLERRLGIRDVKPDELLTVIFTSGSTGQPKGVMLSHANVGSNIAAIDKAVHLTADDVALGVLPFFHSYGYTAAMWSVLALPPKGVFHFNPLDGKEVGKLCREHGVTVFMGTPTFLRMYLKRCEAEDFSKLDIVFAAAEKLPNDLADAFEEKYGMRPFEAYGATELSPLVAVNIPDTRLGPGVPKGTGSRDGSVGRAIPGVEVRVVDPDTWQDLGRDRPGMLLVRGPNVMQGYLHQQRLTDEVIRDGWYITGDIAIVDSDGFIHITGRQSRFSKIGGEMVPHIKIEETIQQVLKLGEDELRAVVTAVPDAKKGERIVVLYTELGKTPEEVCKLLSTAGLPNLWIPGQDSFVQVEKIPVLGTGKLDLKAIKELAAEKVGS